MRMVESIQVDLSDEPSSLLYLAIAGIFCRGDDHIPMVFWSKSPSPTNLHTSWRPTFRTPQYSQGCGYQAIQADPHSLTAP